MANLTAICCHARVRRLAGNGKCGAGSHYGRLRLSVAFLVLSTLACDGLLDSDHALTATITVDRAVLQRTDTAQINVTVTNQSARPVPIETSPCPPKYEIVNSTGRVVAPFFGTLCTPIPVLRTLEPAESYVFEYRWSAKNVRTAGELLPSGKYGARVAVFFARRHGTGAPVSITLAGDPY